MRAYLRDSNSACQTSTKRRLLIARSGCALATVLSKDLLCQLLILTLAATCTWIQLWSHMRSFEATLPSWMMSSNETSGFFWLAIATYGRRENFG